MTKRFCINFQQEISTFPSLFWAHPIATSKNVSNSLQWNMLHQSTAARDGICRHEGILRNVEL